jgi:hypothetical protein
VLSYIRRGLLEGRAEGEGVKRTWYVSIDSLNALRAQRFAQGSAEVFRESSAEQVAESVAEALMHISERLAEEAAQAAEFRTRLELTEQTQSSVEEEARKLREENELLRAQLVGTERRSSKGFWRRILRGRRGNPPAWR